MKTDVNITIDLDELFDELRKDEQRMFIEEHLDVLDISVIRDFVEERGYKLIEEDDT